jgi:PKD repeat protein
MSNLERFILVIFAVFVIVCAISIDHASAQMSDNKVNLSLADLRITDEYGNSLSRINVNQEIGFYATIMNHGNFEQDYVYSIEIVNEDGETITDPIAMSSSLNPNQSVEAALIHMFESPGHYTITATIHEEMDPQTDFAPPITVPIVVENEILMINTAPPSETTSKEAYFVFTSNQVGTTFHCKLDKGQFEECKSPIFYDNLEDGIHSFQIKISGTTKSKSEQLVQHTWLVTMVPTSLQYPNSGIYGEKDPCLNLVTDGPYFQIYDNALKAVYEISVFSCSKLNQIISLDVSKIDGSESVFDWNDFIISPDSYSVSYLYVEIPDNGIQKYSFVISAKAAIENNEGLYYIAKTEHELSLESPILVITHDGYGETIIDETSTFSARKFFDLKDTVHTYEWDFGDNTKTEEGKDVGHTYKIPGQYYVTLKGIDKQGKQVASAEYNVYVSETSYEYSYIEPTYDTPDNLSTHMHYGDYIRIVEKYIVPIIFAGFMLWYFLRKPIENGENYPKFYLERIIEKF